MSTESASLREPNVFESGLTRSNGTNFKKEAQYDHPAGPPKHGLAKQGLRLILFAIYFFGSALFIHGAQLLTVPLYLIDRDLYYSCQAVTKQYAALLLTTGTQWWSSTTIRISGDASVASQLRLTADGHFKCDFPERVILMANHQIYTDWLYLWWSAYTSGAHGYVYIILKKSLRYVPMIGPAMMMWSFIFMARKWATDQKTMRHRLQKLNKPHTNHDGTVALDPLWLLIFPEGTNLSPNARASSAKWAKKTDIEDMKYQILPRSLGLQFCLQEIGKTVEYVYDCTITYEHIPPGQYGQDIFTLRSVYFEGRPPKSVNMHWRRFKVSEIPYDDKDAMQEWIMQRWREKDEIMDTHMRTGRLPADPAAVKREDGKVSDGYIETEVRPSSPFEFLQMFVPVITAYLVCRALIKMVNFASTGRFSDV